MKTALLIVDVINRMDFDGAEALLEPALAMAERLAALKRRARAAGVPVIYVNDNFDEWSLDFRSLVDEIVDQDLPGRPIAERLRPDADDLYVIKPRHSGFHFTPLEILLEQLKVQRLIICGIQTHLCVLFTAQGAHMRKFEIAVPADCSAAERPVDHDAALLLLRDSLSVDVRESGELEL